MQAETITVFIAAPKSAVFNYMADLSNLPEWAIEFCQDLKVEADQYKAMTPMGEMIVSADADEQTGVIDFYASPDGQPGFPVATRILSLPDGQTACMAAFFRQPGMPEEVYQDQLASLRKEMNHMKALFAEA